MQRIEHITLRALMDPAQYTTYKGMLKPEYWSTPVTKNIYRAICKIHDGSDGGQTIDFDVLSAALQQAGHSGQEYEYTLAHILQEHFFVCVIWTNSYDPLRNVPGRRLEISGTPENIEIAEYVYNYVVSLSKHLWSAHRRECRESGGTKLQYLAGLLHGLHEKLDSQRRQLKEEQGLVWLGDTALKEYFRYLYPRTTTVGGSGVTRGERYEAGIEDGRKISIHKGIGGAAQTRGRLLE